MKAYKDIPTIIEISVIDRRGAFKSGLTVTYNVYKSSDNSLVQSGTMTEVGTSGIYQATITFTEATQFRAEYTTPISYENIIETILVEEVSIGDINDLIKRILGLTQENYRIFNPQYSKHGNMESAIVKIYPTANDCNNDTNALAEYEVTATHNYIGRMTGYKVIKL
jgi:hypothetical protein